MSLNLILRACYDEPCYVLTNRIVRETVTPNMRQIAGNICKDLWMFFRCRRARIRRIWWRSQHEFRRGLLKRRSLCLRPIYACRCRQTKASLWLAALAHTQLTNKSSFHFWILVLSVCVSCGWDMADCSRSTTAIIDSWFFHLCRWLWCICTCFVTSLIMILYVELQVYIDLHEEWRWGSRESRGDGSLCCGVPVEMETIVTVGMEQHCAGFPQKCISDFLSCTCGNKILFSNCWWLLWFYYHKLYYWLLTDKIS